MRLHCVSSRLPNSSGLCISRLLCRTSRLLCAISLLLCAISLLLCTISLLLCTRPSPSHLQLRFWPHSNTVMAVAGAHRNQRERERGQSLRWVIACRWSDLPLAVGFREHTRGRWREIRG